MAPQTIPSGKVTLTYPLYACDFDPQDATRLVVSGGGGPGRSGVGNKITVLGTEAPYQLDEVAEIDLSKEEDSVMCLAVGPTKGSSTTIYAGVNSSPQEVTKGNNQHFRVFSVESPKKGGKATASRIVEQSRSEVFANKDKKDAYQRIVRLSRPFEGTQLGVVTTGMAQMSEAVVFDTSASKTGTVNIRGRVETNLEPNDADTIQSGKNEYLFAYCTNKDLFLKRFAPDSDQEEAELIHTIPGPESTGNPPVMSFRGLRFLTSEFVLALTNLDGLEGVVLQVIRLPSKDYPKARIALQKRLPWSVRKATGFAVTCLTPPAFPELKSEAAEFVVAVVGQDKSVTILTLDYQSNKGISIVANFALRRVLKEVHPASITGIALSNFIPPKSGSVEKPVLKLGTVGIANTVVTHTLPVKTTTYGTPRYVLDVAAPATSISFYIISAIVILLLSVVTQGIMEVRGSTPELLGAKNYLTPFQQSLLKPAPGHRGIFEDIRDYISPPSSISSIIPEAATAVSEAIPTSPLHEIISSLVAEKSDPSGDKDSHVIFIREDSEGTDPKEPASIKADLHHEDIHGPHGGKTWEELTEKERHHWVKKLKDLGHSVEDLGFTVMKGVVFGTIGGAIGAAVG